MKKVSVDLDKLTWPDKCVICNGPATKKLVVESSSTKAAAPLGPVVVTIGKTTRISHPICKKHFISSWLASGLSQRNLFYLLLGVVSVFTALSSAIGLYKFALSLLIEKEIKEFPVISIAYTAIYWGIFYWARKNTPVKITGKSYFGTTFQFRNDEYANDFAKINGRTS